MARGGKRSGSGRKKKAATQVAEDIALRVLNKVNAEAKWEKLLASKDERIVLDTMKYLQDRAFGKAAQLILGDPTRPVALSIDWGSRPEWARDSGA